MTLPREARHHSREMLAHRVSKGRRDACEPGGGCTLYLPEDLDMAQTTRDSDMMEPDSCANSALTVDGRQ